MLLSASNNAHNLCLFCLETVAEHDGERCQHCKRYIHNRCITLRKSDKKIVRYGMCEFCRKYWILLIATICFSDTLVITAKKLLTAHFGNDLSDENAVVFKVSYLVTITSAKLTITSPLKKLLITSSTPPYYPINGSPRVVFTVNALKINRLVTVRVIVVSTKLVTTWLHP